MARLSYIKVVEFQARGLVHLHVVRPRRRRGRAERAAAALARRGDARQRRRVVPSPKPPSRCPTSGERRCAGPAGAPNSTSGYSSPATMPTPRPSPPTWPSTPTKTADGTTVAGAPDPHPGRDRAPGTAPPHRGHGQDGLGARAAGATCAPLRLRDHAHTLGYPGQFSSKSVAFSTTFGALRRARADYVHGERGGDVDSDTDFDYDGEWRYAGRGYGDPEADVLAAALLEARLEGSRRVPGGSRSTSRKGSRTP